MSIAIGSDTVQKVYLGDQSVLSMALGTNLVYEESSGPVLLDWISFDPSDGQPFFNTGVYQSNDLVVEVALSAESWNAMYPCFGGGCQDTGFLQELFQATRIFGIGNTFYADGRGRLECSQPSFGQGMNTLSVNFGGQSGQKVVLWNGTQLDSHNPNGNLDTTYQVCINAWLNRPGDTSPQVNQAGTWRMGYFKLWQGGQLVRDFRPCGETNDAHLWDQVTRTEYSPEQGTCTGGYIES